MFSPEYIRLVLNENFEDAKALLLDPLLAIHRAHLVMLAERDIVSAADARRACDRPSTRSTLPRFARCRTTVCCEDLYFYVDGLIARTAGAELARPSAHRPQPQRHRHDDVPDATAAGAPRRGRLGAQRSGAHCCEVALRHRETIFPRTRIRSLRSRPRSRTICSAVIEERERDTARIFAAYERTNQNPLGACAITGTGFPDRPRSARASSWASPARPGIPTAASRPSTTCSKPRPPPR